jgi:uncharacterized protein
MIDQIPALLRIAIVFIVILAAIRRKLSLGNAFLMGAVILGIVFKLNVRQIFHSIVAAITDPKTLSLAVIVGLILILSNSMEKGGQMRRLLENFRGLVSNPRLNLTIFPALIGLLPMPGGALFSAPMVKELGDRSGLSDAQLSFVNYWFRHIWEYWWPLYPGVLLAVVLSDVNLALYVLFMVPLTVAAVYFGRQALKRMAASVRAPDRSGRPSAKPFLKELVPILIVIVPGLGAGVLIAAIFPTFTVAKQTGLIVCLCLAILWVWRQNHFTGGKIRALLLDTQLLNMFYMVAAILIFEGILSDSRAVQTVSDALIALKIPLLLMTALLPFMVGMIGGIAIAFVGTTFPILIPMIHALGATQFLLPYLMLAMVCGFVGVLLSPLHLCLILSNEYFQTEWVSVFKLLWRPCAALVLSAFIYFGLLYWGCARIFSYIFL